MGPLGAEPLLAVGEFAKAQKATYSFEAQDTYLINGGHGFYSPAAEDLHG